MVYFISYILEYVVINYTFKMLFCVILLVVMEICTSMSGTIMNKEVCALIMYKIKVFLEIWLTNKHNLLVSIMGLRGNTKASWIIYSKNLV